MHTDLEIKPYGRYKLEEYSRDHSLMRLSAMMICPNCGAEERYFELIDKAVVDSSGIPMLNDKNKLPLGTTYTELAELNRQASLLFTNVPTHSLSDCFKNLLSEVDDLRGRVRDLEGSITEITR